jgi:dTDP-glucose 4,6-dehydratase
MASRIVEQTFLPSGLATIDLYHEWDDTRNQLIVLEMQPVLVTGGAGFIGSNFVRAAVAHGARVIVVDKLTYAGSRLNLQDVAGQIAFIEADIGDGPRMKRVLHEHEPDWVVNFAAETHVDRSIDGPRAFVTTNIVGTFELLQATREHLVDASAARQQRFRFLHVSTDEVYGALGPSGAFTEDTAYAPNSPYAASKAAADHLARSYHETFRLPVLITNCSNNYGPYQFPEKLIPLTILNALDGRPLPIYGDGLNVRDWLHVEDHCQALLTILERGAPGDRYNVGATCEKTNVEVVDAICAILDRVSPPAHLGIGSYSQLKAFVADRPGHDRRYAIDAGHLRESLGWRPRYQFAEGLEQTVRWYVDHREWCAAVQAGRYNRQRLGLTSSR